MDTLSTHSSNIENSMKSHNNNSSISLFFSTNDKTPYYRRANSFTKYKVENTITNHKNHFSKSTIKKHYRKDIYGNVIKKGGKHKISFKDNFKGNYLVEMTLIDVHQNSLRGNNYKNLTVFREARDKEQIFCSGLCNVF